ncbi:histidine kinase [Nocardiopsis sp. NPDC006198]|uniref:sensor histidine kinase n=1 Tax=Nocardiopsis sp. NPDC006198 TaxID=3154472 RepID=UPI00339E001C
MGPEGADDERYPPGGPAPRPLALFDAALTRVGLRGPLSRDLLLGAFIALASAPMLLSVVVLARAEGVPFSPTAVAVLAALTVAQSLVLGVRRRSPLLCLFLVVATQVGVFALLPGDVAYQGLAPYVAAYTCGTVLPLRRLSWILVAVAAVMGVSGFVFALPPFASLSPPARVPDPVVAGTARLLSAAISFGLAGFVGNSVAVRRRFARLERLRVIEAEQERTNRAIRAERALMARELHDIAAHHLSGMVVQAGAAEKLAARDAPAIAETIGWIRIQGRETLESLRMVVGALREPGAHPHESPGAGSDGSRADGAPVPGVAVLDRLVAGARAQGCEVVLERTGSTCRLPPVADVTFYRVAQEALANARDHAWGAPVRVVLDHRGSEVVLRVDNDPGVEREGSPKGLRGLGLVGMKERADLIGAVLEAGPTDSGGWRVRLTLPIV